MKIYISADFEGLNGVCRFSQTEMVHTDLFNTTIEQALKEVNTVINAAFKAGAETVSINDAHSIMSNFNLNRLDERASLITGKPKQVSMMAGLDRSYTAAILLGYHAKSETAGACLAHTFSDLLASVKINSQEVGESFLSSAYAATLGVPLAMVTGDEALKEEVYNLIGDVPVVVSKKALGMSSAICRPNAEYLKELEETTIKTLNNPTNWIINKVNPPYELEVELTQIVMADLVQLIPGIERLNSKTIKFTHSSFQTVYQLIQAICVMTGTTHNYY